MKDWSGSAKAVFILVKGLGKSWKTESDEMFSLNPILKINSNSQNRDWGRTTKMINEVKRIKILREQAWTPKTTRSMTKGWSEKIGKWEEYDNVNKSLRSLKGEKGHLARGRGYY